MKLRKVKELYKYYNADASKFEDHALSHSDTLSA